MSKNKPQKFGPKIKESSGKAAADLIETEYDQKMAQFVQEIQLSKGRLVSLQKQLKQSLLLEIPTYRAYLDEIVRDIGNVLTRTIVPDFYQIAVVGNFNAGKSSFINELLEKQFTSVRESRETSAISIFRYGKDVRAEIKFISKGEWDEQQRVCGDDFNSKHPEAARYVKFMTFKENADMTSTNIRVEDVGSYLQPEGHIETIYASDWTTREGLKRFRQELRRYTSAQSRLPYLVDTITIYAPMPVLQGGIELIDTPGLQDTERFRERMTEERIREVDAILFLTSAIEPYKQNEKDFIVTKLGRMQKLSHLQIVITRADEAYHKACKDATREDEEPPSYDSFKQRKIDEVKTQLKQTLDEVVSDNEISEEIRYRFIDMLDNIPVYLTSVEYNEIASERHKAGIDSVRESLSNVLASGKRYSEAKKALDDCWESSVDRLKAHCEEWLAAIQKEYDSERVEHEIASIKKCLSEHHGFFNQRAEAVISELEQAQAQTQKHLPDKLELICHKADDVIGEFEKVAIKTPWQTRRARNWGTLNDLQNRIADRVFLKVHEYLEELKLQFSQSRVSFGKHIETLQQGIYETENKHQISGLGQLVLAEKQDIEFRKLENIFDVEMKSYRDEIVRTLDAFVSSDIKNRLESARDKVRGIGGKGTKIRQEEEIERFYQTIRSLLKSALREHVEMRCDEFAEAILTHARSLAPELRKMSEKIINERIQAIESAKMIKAGTEEKQIVSHLQDMLAFIDAVSGSEELERQNSSHEETINALHAQYEQDLNLACVYEKEAIEAKTRVTEMKQDNYYLREQNKLLLERIKDKAGQNSEVGIPIPTEYESMEDWSNKYLAGRLVLHPRALRGIKKAKYEDVELVYKSLLLLADTYRNMQLGIRTKEEWERSRASLELQCSPSISEHQAGKQGNDYDVNYPLDSKRTRFLEWHLTRGKRREERYCLRIYFFWDADTEQVVVGWLPSHLDTEAT